MNLRTNNIFKNSISFFIGILVLGIITKLFLFSVDEKKEDLNHHDQFKKDYKIYSLNIPEKIEFAGETIPIQIIDVKEKFDRELLVNTYWQSQTMLFIKRSNKYFNAIERILEEENIPQDFKYLALIESGLTHVVSPSGAASFWQIMKTTARERGLEVNSDIDERYNLLKSTKAACDYLKEAKEKFGSWTLAAASYNMGMNGLEKQLEKQKVNSYFDLILNDETARYIYRILAVKEILSSPFAYGFNYREKDLYFNVETYTVEVDTTINNLVDFSKSQGINLKVLKQFNPWLRTNRLPNSSARTYQITLPKKEFLNLLVTNSN